MAKVWMLAMLGLSVLAPQGAAATSRGLYGVVMRGPTKPVCSSEESCTEPAAHVRLRFVRNGAAVSATTTDADGRYRIRLAQGLYLVRVAGSPAGRIGSRITPAKVRVRAVWRHQDFDIDTGIR
jgi:hypothetical protein